MVNANANFTKALFVALVTLCSPAQAGPSCSVRIINIVAHEDDDLLFLSPDLSANAATGACVRTIYVTAGDGGFGFDYALGRIEGIKDAYAAMTNSKAPWHVEDRIVNGRVLTVATQPDAPNLSLFFLGLPDGDFPGEGFDRNDNQSLHKLVRAEICSVNSVYTKQAFGLMDLRAILRTLIDEYRPTTLRIQDLSAATPDHSDHHAAVAVVRSILKPREAFSVASYRDYITFFDSENVRGPEFDAKRSAFAAYAAHDVAIGNFDESDNPYYYWLRRQYRREARVVPVMVRTRVGDRCPSLRMDSLLRKPPRPGGAVPVSDPSTRTGGATVTSGRCFIFDRISRLCGLTAIQRRRVGMCRLRNRDLDISSGNRRVD